MNRTIVMSLLLLATLSWACGPTSGPEVDATGSGNPGATRSALLDAHEGWVTAFEDADVDAVARFLEPSGRFLLFHPEQDGRYHDLDEVREGLTRMFNGLGDPAWTEVHLEARAEGGAGWLTYHLVLESSTGGEPFVGRATEVWVFHPDGWRLAHAHWSRTPPGADAPGIEG